MITQLSVDISNDPFSGLKRKLVHELLRIESNLEMTHDRKIVLYEKIDDGSEQGAYGRPMLNIIEQDSSLSEEQKVNRREMFKSIIVRVNTNGVLVNEQGLPVESEGIPELQFWQSLPLSFIQPPPQTVSDAIYSLLKISMKAQDNQGRI